MMDRKNDDQNMATKRPSTAPFETSLPPIDSPESHLSIGAKLVKNGSVQVEVLNV